MGAESQLDGRIEETAVVLVGSRLPDVRLNSDTAFVPVLPDDVRCQGQCDGTWVIQRTGPEPLPQGPLGLVVM